MSTDWPSLTVTFASVQPTGRNCTHGTIDADGTAWASSHSGSRSVQATLLMNSGVALASSLAMLAAMVCTMNNTRTIATAQSPIRRRLQRWIRIGCGGVGSSLVNSACRSRPWARSMCRSWEGMASPRAAANPSVISSTEN